MSGSFELGDVEENETGWGPTALPADMSDVPYAPFSKGDKLGRVADWTGMNVARAERVYSTGMTNQSFNLSQQDENFEVVDFTKPKSTPYSFKNAQRQPFKKDANKSTPVQRNFQKLGSTKPKTGNKNYKKRQNWVVPGKIREPSVEVKPEWKQLEEIEFNRLTKMTYEVPAASDVKICGSLSQYDKSFDRMTPRNERIFPGVGTFTPRVSTSQDPIIQELAKSKAANVFGTDAIIALLMASPRSVYPWDIVIDRVGDQLFFDKRDASQIDLFTVSENVDPPLDGEGINSPDNLAMEATTVNQQFIEQVLLKSADKHKFAEPSPFPAEDAPVHKAFRYRKYKLDEKNTVILRTELDAVTGTGPFMNISLKTLLEFDPKPATNWRAKLDAQRGAIMATEIKANSNKLTRWTAEALLAGVDQIKLGFVSRTNPKDRIKHSTLATSVLKPTEFASQINFQYANGWGIVKSIVDYALSLPAGKYLMVKDPNKSLMRLYQVPADTFAEVVKAEEEGEEGEEQEVIQEQEEYDE